MPAYVGRECRGILLEQHDIADQSGSGVSALEQVVAENAVFRQPPVDGLPEHVHVINPLADKRPLLEHVLVNVGYGVGVGVDAGLAGEEPCESGPARAGYADANARLKDAVSLGHAPELLVIVRAIQGVSHRSDKLPRRIARELRVAIQRDHIPHGFQIVGCADDRVEPALLPAERPVEVLELASFSFPSHPDVLAGVPAPIAVEQEKAALSLRLLAACFTSISASVTGGGFAFAAAARVFGIERFDSVARLLQERLVLGH